MCDILKTLFSSLVLGSSVIVNGAVPEMRWTSFANAPFVPFSSEIREFFAQYDPSGEGRYIAHHWGESRETLRLSELPVNLVSSLSHSGVPSLTETMVMWQGINAEMLSSFDGSIVELANVCGRANKEKVAFPASYLPVLRDCLLDSTLNARERIEMIIQALRMMCSWADVAKTFPLLGEDYVGLIDNPRVHLPATEDDRRLIEALKQRGFVEKV